MKKQIEEGAYVAPKCEIVAVSTEKGLCLSSGNASHDGFVEEDYEW